MEAFLVAIASIKVNKNNKRGFKKSRKVTNNMDKFYFKLIDGSKIQTNESEFGKGLHNLGRDFVVCYSSGGIPIYVKKDKIFSGHKLKGGDKSGNMLKYVI